MDHHTFHVVSGLASGGVITSIVSDDPSTEVGQWALDDDHNVVATFYVFAVAPGGPTAPSTALGTVKIHIKARLRGNTLSGTYEATGTTPAGGELFPPDNGTFSGKRIRADS